MDINKPMTVDDEIAYNNYKLTADKIIQLLSQIREDPSASAKRWVWELLQNALYPKDDGIQIGETRNTWYLWTAGDSSSGYVWRWIGPEL